MSNHNSNNLDIPYIPRLHRRGRDPSPSPLSNELEEEVFNFLEAEPSNPVTLPDITFNNILARQQATASVTLATQTATMPPPDLSSLTVEQQLEKFRELAMQQQAQLDQQNTNMQALQQQHLQSQASVAQLSAALQSLTALQQPQQQPSRARKKPEIPALDLKNIINWIKRLEKAYERAEVVLAKDKFAFLENIFDVAMNPTVNRFLYGDNTDQDWNDFLQYLKKEYGPTRRQKAKKLIAEAPRNGLKPSQYLIQLEEDTSEVTIDDIRKEHLLKTLPPWIREYLGESMETRSAQELAQMADTFFDRQGNPLEKSLSSVNHIGAASSSSNNSSTFTAAFSAQDDNAEDINAIRRSTSRGRGNFNRSRSRNRSNNGFKRNVSPAASSSGSNSRTRSPARGFAQGQQNLIDGICWYHHTHGTEAQKCAPGCKQANASKSNQGNGRGGRRQ